MLGFIKSKEFWLTTLLLVIVFIFRGTDELSSYIQDFGLYGWAYVIWKMEKHHAIVKSLFEDEE